MSNQLINIVEANLSEWNHTIAENNALKSDLRTLRRKYVLPIKHSEFHKWYSLDSSDQLQHKKIEDFHKDVMNLAAKNDINMDKWESALIYLIILDEPGPISLGGGFPKVQVSVDSEGKMTQDVQFDLETAVENPIVQKFIADIRKHNVLIKDPPPLPKKQVGSRKVDWRPIWE
jgi:hypothetical protein